MTATTMLCIPTRLSVYPFWSRLDGRALVDLIQHPFYRCQFDPIGADTRYRVVIVGEAMTARVHLSYRDCWGKEVRDDEKGRGDINVKPFSSWRLV